LFRQNLHIRDRRAAIALRFAFFNRSMKKRLFVALRSRGSGYRFNSLAI
jgi:hypothetical protein